MCIYPDHSGQTEGGRDYSVGYKGVGVLWGGGGGNIYHPCMVKAGKHNLPLRWSGADGGVPRETKSQVSPPLDLTLENLPNNFSKIILITSLGENKVGLLFISTSKKGSPSLSTI